jgi:hypothetical protein
MLTSHLVAVPALALTLLVPPSTRLVAQESHFDEAGDVVAEQAFELSVRQYVSLRRRLEPSLPPLRVSGAEELTHAVHALAAAIRTARAGARAGDIFCAEAAEMFRIRIAQTLAAGGDTVDDLLAERDEEPSAGVGPLVVNERFPYGRSAAMWPALLAALPQLPKELQYRIVDRDLALIDIDAGLVVDILPDALPAR